MWMSSDPRHVPGCEAYGRTGGMMMYPGRRQQTVPMPGGRQAEGRLHAGIRQSRIRRQTSSGVRLAGAAEDRLALEMETADCNRIIDDVTETSPLLPIAWFKRLQGGPLVDDHIDVAWNLLHLVLEAEALKGEMLCAPRLEHADLFSPWRVWLKRHRPFLTAPAKPDVLVPAGLLTGLLSSYGPRFPATFLADFDAFDLRRHQWKLLLRHRGDHHPLDSHVWGEAKAQLCDPWVEVRLEMEGIYSRAGPIILPDDEVVINLDILRQLNDGHRPHKIYIVHETVWVDQLFMSVTCDGRTIDRTMHNQLVGFRPTSYKGFEEDGRLVLPDHVYRPEEFVHDFAHPEEPAWPPLTAPMATAVAAASPRRSTARRSSSGRRRTRVLASTPIVPLIGIIPPSIRSRARQSGTKAIHTRGRDGRDNFGGLHNAGWNYPLEPSPSPALSPIDHLAYEEDEESSPTDSPRGPPPSSLIMDTPAQSRSPSPTPRRFDFDGAAGTGEAPF